MYLLRKAFNDLDESMARKAYTTYVRPILEYANPVWSPYLRKDIELVEKPQRLVTKIPKTLKQLEYEDRCQKLKILRLCERRERYDLIETYKILNDGYNVESFRSFFTKSIDGRLRGHPIKLQRERVKTNCRYHFIINRVVNSWNDLPEECVTAKNAHAFKSLLDRTKYQL